MSKGAIVVHAKAKAGRPKWLTTAIKEHGSTQPVKLEFRRQKLTEVVCALSELIKEAHEQKQKYLENAEKLKEEVKELAERVKVVIKAAEAGNRDKATESLQLQNEYRIKRDEVFRIPERIFQFDLIIGELLFKKANIESTCLLIDCNSVRLVAKGKRSRRKGYYRYPAALYLANLCFESERTADAMEFMAELPDEPEKPAGPDDGVIEVDDEEIFDGEEEDKKK